MPENNFILAFKECLKANIVASDSHINDEVIGKLQKYYDLSVKWGSAINITNNLSIDKFLLENLFDPLLSYFAYSNHLETVKFEDSTAENRVVIDLGCGGGFTGIVWHILSNGRFETILLDSDRKKINFCKQVIRELGLSGITAVQSRVEDFVMNRSYNLIVSRATWKPVEFLDYTDKFCKINPTAQRIHFSSEKQVLELDEVGGVIEKHGKITKIPYQIQPVGYIRYLTLAQR